MNSDPMRELAREVRATCTLLDLLCDRLRTEIMLNETDESDILGDGFPTIGRRQREAVDKALMAAMEMHRTRIGNQNN